MNAQAWMDKAQRAVASASVLLDAGDADGACNRAYYAMFDAARAALQAMGQPVGRTLRGLLSAFSEHLVKSGAFPSELGRLLKQAESRRYLADYEAASIEPADAHEAVRQAEAFVAAVRQRISPPIQP